MPIAFVEGETTIHSPAEAFLPTFERRVLDGLFAPGNRKRANYVITTNASDGLRFRAKDWATAASIGLNEVELRASGSRLRFQVRYPRWAAFVLALGAAIGAALIAAFLIIDLPRYIRAHPLSQIPGLSIGLAVAAAWGLAIFFGFVWPWLLILFHRGQVRNAMRTLIAEVDRVAMIEGELRHRAWPPR
jgi:hypothetical protein